MPWYRNPFNYYGDEENQIELDLAKANANFTELEYAFVNNDPTTRKVKDADKLDGYDASLVPKPNVIPVTNANGKLSDNWLEIIDGGVW